MAGTDPVTRVLDYRDRRGSLDPDDDRADVAVLVVDVIGLAAINAANGRLAGDLVLRRVADVLRTGVRAADVVARIGGDEFMVVLTGDGREAESTAQRLRETLSLVGIEATIGHAVAEPGEPFRATFQRADRAMYDMKRRRAAGA